jgi:hypothetical protein
VNGRLRTCGGRRERGRRQGPRKDERPHLRLAARCSAWC